MKDKLFLIDGHALIFKMYYAFLRKPMINSKGADMSILFGFTKYILELIEKERPTHFAVAFDPPGGTFRNEIYSEYKANRSETPQLVIDALEPLVGICKALDIPVLMLPGYEADDVIGSMAKKIRGENMDVYMVTPDKDYGQLIEDGIYQYKPGKAGEPAEILDSAAICTKYGICNPLQVIEMLTICGDTADNVPGVKGVGEVGASKLISKFGTVRNIYEHLDELTPRQKAQFEAAQEHIGLSHELVTIKTDIPLETNAEDMRLTLKFTSEIADLFELYEFNSLKKFIPDFRNATKTESRKSIELCVEESGANDFIAEAEQNGQIALKADQATGTIMIATCPMSEKDKDNSEKISVTATSGNISDFKSIIENAEIVKYGYDLKQQIRILCGSGIELGGKLLDIKLMHYLINPEKSHNPEILTKSYLDIDIVQENDVDENAEPASLFDTMSESSPEDNNLREIAATLPTGMKIRDELLDISSKDYSLSSLYDNMEEPLTKVLAKMESDGVKVDLNQLKEFTDCLRSEMNGLESQIREMVDEPDLNISSPKQIGEVLFDKLKLDPKAKAGKKGYSTDEATLTALSGRHPVIGKILEFRAVKKLLSTYIEPFPSYISMRDGRVHTTFNQALTATGRLSSSNPNLQNIPIRTERGKEIRKAFVPGTPDGYILSADYSQIELRIMAHLSQDQHLIQAFRDGVDVHKATASKIFGIPHEEITQEQRRIAKTANFGIMYGISSFGLAQRLGVSRSEAKKIIDDYFAAFPAIRSYIDYTIATARENGYVETIFGRRRYLPDINAKNASIRALAERNAVNAPIQGTSADIIKLAMIEVDKKISEAGLKSRMVLQIHDELLFDTVNDEVGKITEIVKNGMEHVTELSVPLTVECNYGKNWLEAH